MSNTGSTVIEDQFNAGALPPEAFDLPTRSSNSGQFTSRKTTYWAGKDNEFSFLENDTPKIGVARLDKIRLGRIVARIQPLADGSKKLIVTMGIILDGEEIGRLDSDGNFEPHPMYSEPRYARWQDRSERPHRINANQWVQKDNVPNLKRLVHHAQSNHGWQVIQNPAKAKGRETQDLFIARPPQAPQGTDPSKIGILLDGFEVSVNPDYEQGFKSFWQGLDEQQSRWEFAMGLENPNMRQAALLRLSENIHFLGGYYRDDAQKDWARPVDVGALYLDKESFPLYEAKGNQPLSDDLFAELDAPAGTTGPSIIPTAPSAAELELPLPPGFEAEAQGF